MGWLRGGLGNAIFFFVCTAVTMASFMPVMLSEAGSDVAASPVDLLGVSLPLSSMLQGTMAALPNINAGNSSVGPIPLSLSGPLQTFIWAGVKWTPSVISGRLILIAAAVAITFFSSLFFNRFDPARERRRSVKGDSGSSPDFEPWKSSAIPSMPEPLADIPLRRLSRLDQADTRFSLLRMLAAELCLLRKGLPWWWLLVAPALVIAGFALPTRSALRYLLPLTWLWPLLIWSALGSREVRYRTEALLYSAAHPLSRQLPATWLAGVLVTALTGIGVAFNLLLAADIAGLAAWMTAVFFIPTLSLACAVWSGSSKLFEVIYLSLWYVGPMNLILPQLDFMGAGGTLHSLGSSQHFLIVTAALIGITCYGRRRQIQK